MTHERALVMFVREPRLGKVKTRLSRDIPSKDVLGLYKAFIKDLLNIIREVDAQPYIFYYGRPGYTPFLSSQACKFKLIRQIGSNLGQRMLNAQKYTFRQGHKSCIIIGSDCLTLTPEILRQGFSKLFNYDCILGPSKDGGYYLIGANQPQPHIFKGISWSTDSVYAATVAKIRQKGLKHANLVQMEDIDSSRNLAKLAKMIGKYPHLRHTRRVLKNITL